MSTERNPTNAATPEKSAAPVNELTRTGEPVDSAEIARVRTLTEQLRCLVCQNQTIADSNAGLAIDLREQVVKQVRSGRTDTEIKQYMVERYGDFVLYDPPFSTTNSVLWVGPFVLLALGLLLVWRSVVRRHRSPDASSQPSAEQRAQLQVLEARYQASTPSASTASASTLKDSVQRRTR
jgi:cytochrome c-type biogenesis protein CcmH